MGTHPIFESDFDCLTDMSDDDFDELPDDVNVFTGKSYDQINNFFNDDGDLETVDFQSTIAPSTVFHNRGQFRGQRPDYRRGGGGQYQNGNGGRFRPNFGQRDRQRPRRNYQHTTQK